MLCSASELTSAELTSAAIILGFRPRLRTSGEPVSVVARSLIEGSTATTGVVACSVFPRIAAINSFFLRLPASMPRLCAIRRRSEIFFVSNVFKSINGML